MAGPTSPGGGGAAAASGAREDAGPCTDAQLQQLWQLLVQYHKGLKSDSTNDGISLSKPGNLSGMFDCLVNYVAYVTKKACPELQRIHFNALALTKGPHRTVALWAALMRLVENRTKQDAQEPLWIAIARDDFVKELTKLDGDSFDLDTVGKGATIIYRFALQRLDAVLDLHGGISADPGSPDASIGLNQSAMEGAAQRVTTKGGGPSNFAVFLKVDARRHGSVAKFLIKYANCFLPILAEGDKGDPPHTEGYSWDNRGYSCDLEFMMMMCACARVSKPMLVAQGQTRRQAEVIQARLKQGVVCGGGMDAIVSTDEDFENTRTALGEGVMCFNVLAEEKLLGGDIVPLTERVAAVPDDVMAAATKSVKTRTGGKRDYAVTIKSNPVMSKAKYTFLFSAMTS